MSSKVSDIVHELSKHSGLVPTKIDIKTGKFSHFRDSKINSHYEYLLKQWIQTGMKKSFSWVKLLVILIVCQNVTLRQTDFSMIEDYKSAIVGIKQHLMREYNGSYYFGQLSFREKFIKIQELESCFFPVSFFKRTISLLATFLWRYLRKNSLF